MERTPAQKDEILTQFLGMTEERCDADVAVSILESVNWDLNRAVNSLYEGGDRSPPAPGPQVNSNFGDGPQVVPPPRLPQPVPAAVQPPANSPPAEERSLGGQMIDAVSSFFGGGSAVEEPSRGSRGAGSGAGAVNRLSQEEQDAEMARALQESMNGAHMGQESEESQLQRALQASQQQDRDSLRQQQEMELQESLLIDQQRELQRRQEEEELEQVRRAEAAAAAEEEAKKQDKSTKFRQAFEALGPEPDTADPERIALMLRFPNGKAVRRRFRKSQPTADLYAFANGSLLDWGAEELVGEVELHCTFPRKRIPDAGGSLSDAQLEDQSVIMVQGA